MADIQQHFYLPAALITLDQTPSPLPDYNMAVVGIDFGALNSKVMYSLVTSPAHRSLVLTHNSLNSPPPFLDRCCP